MTYPDSARMTGGTDSRGELLAAMADADLLNAGVALRNAHPAADDFRGDSWARRVRHVLALQNVPHAHLTDGDALQTAVRSVGIGTVDIASYVQNTLSRAVGEGFANAPSIWRKLARPVQVRDFKATPAGAVLDVPVALRRIAQAGEAKVPAVAARAETVTAATYGENLAISRQAMLNGQIAPTVQVAEAMGRAAAWTMDDALIDLLTSNSGVGPTLGIDSLALFHTTHNNIVTAGAAPSVSTLNVARSALRKQRDQNSTRRMNTPGRVLLVPAALESTAKILAASEAVPGAADVLDVVTAARLDDANAAGWYLAADPLLYDTLGVAYIGEGPEPAPLVGPLKAAGWSSDSSVFAVRLDFGVVALDYRGLFHNDGA